MDTLKKQLAQIKARALALSGRPIPDDEPVVQPASGSARVDIGNPIVDALVQTGAVTRGADSSLSKSSKRFPWWFKRREAREHQHGFEGQFQRVLAELSDGEPLSFESAVPGEAREMDGASYYLIRLVDAEIDPLSAPEATRIAGFDRWPRDIMRTVVGARRAHSVVDLVDEASPGSLLFLDIETAGLSANTYMFLCGLMYFADGRFVAEQVFARDYTEEEGVLRHVRSMIDRFDTVVTYNGAAFDLPFLRARMAVHRVPDIEPVASADLLHAARRVFRETLPNCRLVTVERFLRGVDRVDDIPSRFIPRAYHEFVHTKDARIMRNVVYHNRMDLFTMAMILNHMVEREVSPSPPSTNAVDILPHALS